MDKGDGTDGSSERARMVREQRARVERKLQDIKQKKQQVGAQLDEEEEEEEEFVHNLNY